MVALGTLFNIGRQIDDEPATRANGSFMGCSFRHSIA